MYRAIFCGAVAAMMASTALFLWALSKELEAFCEMMEDRND